MTEFLSSLLIQTATATLGFAAGALWMRENYISVIHQLNIEIDKLKGQVCWLTQRFY